MVKQTTLCLVLVFLPAAMSLIQNKLLDCNENKYGCCVDGDPNSPEAEGSDKEGCGLKLCEDFEKQPGNCKKYKGLGFCNTPNTHKKSDWTVRIQMMKECARSCGFCS